MYVCMLDLRAGVRVSNFTADLETYCQIPRSFAITPATRLHPKGS